jgi:hypothetical protein
MTSLASARSILADPGQSALQWFAGLRRILVISARWMVLALSPSTHRGADLAARSRHRVEDTAPILLWFTLMTSIVSLVIVQTVVKGRHARRRDCPAKIRRQLPRVSPDARRRTHSPDWQTPASRWTGHRLHRSRHRDTIRAGRPRHE